MSIQINPVTKDLLPSVAELAERHWIPRSLRWYNRCLYLPCDQQDSVLTNRGYAAVRDDGTCAAVQCHHSCTLYFNGKKIPAIQREILAADKDGGGYVFDILSACDKDEADALCYNNDTATVKSIALAKMFCGFSSGPEATGVVHYCWTDIFAGIVYRFLENRPRKTKLVRVVVKLWRPVAAMCANVLLSISNSVKIKRCSKIDKGAMDDFFCTYLKSSKGIVAPRGGETLIQKFQESIDAGTVSMFVVCKKDVVIGYILVRHYPSQNAHEIIDIIALNNNTKVLQALIKRAKCAAMQSNVDELRIVAALPKSDEWLFPLLNRTRPLAGISFMYRTKNEEIMSSLNREEGWFFGPYDGERCLGYGGYVDL